MLRNPRLRLIQLVMQQIELALVVSGLDLALQGGDHHLDVLDAVVEVGHGGARGELFEDVSVARFFGGGMGGDFAEEVVYGVGEELEAVVEVGELGGGGGVGGWVGVLGFGGVGVVEGGLGTFSLLLLAVFFVVIVMMGDRGGAAGGVGGEFEDFERIWGFGGGRR